MDLARFRSEFPVTRHGAYLNHAAVSPLSTSARRAMEGHIAELNERGAGNWPEWLKEHAAARRSLARLVGCDADEIALLQNTSDGLTTLALGLDWRAGDRIVTAECEFPANLVPWLALRARGVRVEFVAQREGVLDLDDLRRRSRGARLVALSWVQYLGGARLNVAAVGQICRQAGAIFVLDAIQGLGALPLRAKAAGVHALAAGGHKWLAGPEGTAVLYVDRELLASLPPPKAGWTTLADWEDFAAAARAAAQPEKPLVWRSDASRFEIGAHNTTGIYGLRAAADLLLEAGVEEVAARILSLTDRLVADLRALGAEVLGRRGLAGGESPLPSGIVSFRCPGRSCQRLLERLRAARVTASLRGGEGREWIRLSPHFYNDEEEIDRAVAAARALLAAPPD